MKPTEISPSLQEEAEKEYKRITEGLESKNAKELKQHEYTFIHFFIAGATSQYVQDEKEKFAIGLLEWADDNFESNAAAGDAKKWISCINGSVNTTSDLLQKYQQHLKDLEK
jgi:hypothetical protein